MPNEKSNKITNSFYRHLVNYRGELGSGDILLNNLMLEGYLPDHWVLPPFIKIESRDNTGQSDSKTRSPVVLFAPKSKLKWRQFSFVHPMNYQKVCEVLSKTQLHEALLKLSDAKHIFSYSLPQLYYSSTENAAKQIRRWTELQDDLLLHSDGYEYILVLDISNCYHTLYTHTIEWALESVGEKELGKELDTAIRRGMDNRTHGLPVGSAPPHYISELVLNKIDREIENTKQVKDYLGGRFRDNYYLLCKSKLEAELLLKEIIIILRKHNLDFNSEKTKIIKNNDYFDSFWRIDFNTILSKLDIDNIDSKVELPIRKIEAFIGLSLRLSQIHNNDKAITDRLVDILEKIEPEYDAYPKYFSLVQRIYQVRTQTLPKVLSLLFLLSTKNEECKRRFTLFLISRLNLAYQGRDNFEMMWVIYFLAIVKVKISEELAIKLSEIKLMEDAFLRLICVYYEKSISDAVLENEDLFEDLWENEENDSKITARFRVVSNAQDLIEILKVNFNSAGFIGGGY